MATRRPGRRGAPSRNVLAGLSVPQDTIDDLERLVDLLKEAQRLSNSLSGLNLGGAGPGLRGAPGRSTSGNTRSTANGGGGAPIPSPPGAPSGVPSGGVVQSMAPTGNTRSTASGGGGAPVSVTPPTTTAAPSQAPPTTTTQALPPRNARGQFTRQGGGPTTTTTASGNGGALSFFSGALGSQNLGGSDLASVRAYHSGALAARLAGSVSTQTLGAGVRYLSAGRSDPGAGISAAGGVISGGLSALGSGLTGASTIAMMGGGALAGAPGGPIGMMVGGALASILGQALGPITEAAAGTVRARFGRLSELRGFERSAETVRALSGMQGGLYSRGVAEGEAFGFGAQESMGMLSSYFGQIGTRNAALAPLPFQSVLSGMSPGALASFVGTGAAGKGAIGGVGATAQQLPLAIGLAQQSGLRGSKVDEYLLRLVKIVEGNAERGLRTSMGGLTGFAADLTATGAAAAGRLGYNPFEGVQAIRAQEALGGIARGASQQFGSPFAQLGQSAMIAAAARGGGGPLAMMRRLQRMEADPRAARGALGVLGGPLAATALAASGLSVDQAQLLTGRLERAEGVTATMGDAVAASQGLGRAFAATERRGMAAAAAMPDNEALIEATGRLERIMITNSETTGKLVDVMSRAVENMAPSFFF